MWNIVTLDICYSDWFFYIHASILLYVYPAEGRDRFYLCFHYIIIYMPLLPLPHSLILSLSLSALFPPDPLYYILCSYVRTRKE